MNKAENIDNKQGDGVLPCVSDCTYEEMYEWLEKHELENPKVVRALMKEIGYELDNDILYDDSDTKEQDLYSR